MKKFLKEFLITLLQLIMFYIFPLFAGPNDAMGMVFIIIISTFALSLLLGILSSQRIKFFYPPIIALLFIPSVFIYYNESALVHALWYLVISAFGIAVGALLKKQIKK